MGPAHVHMCFERSAEGVYMTATFTCKIRPTTDDVTDTFHLDYSYSIVKLFQTVSQHY